MDAHASNKPLTGAFDRGATHIASDCSGHNFYATDRSLRDLLPLYLTREDFAALEPHFDRLGGLAQRCRNPRPTRQTKTIDGSWSNS